MWLLDEKYQGDRCDAFIADCARLKAGEPLAYIIGYIPFRSTIIHLDSRPLIPRTESEFWIGEVIDMIQQEAREYTQSLRILDLCAGSGALGIAVLAEIPHARVDFAEIKHEHHATIQKNIHANRIAPERTRIFGGDLFEQVEGQYAYIISNPPYIDPALDRAEESVKQHEPEIALYGGAKGMEIITRIIATAPRFLTPDGKLVIEHEPEQTEAITALASTYGFTPLTHTDQYDVERYTILEPISKPHTK